MAGTSPAMTDNSLYAVPLLSFRRAFEDKGRSPTPPDIPVEEGRAVAVLAPEDREEALVHRLVAHALVATVDVADLGRMEARRSGDAVADCGAPRPVGAVRTDPCQVRPS